MIAENFNCTINERSITLAHDDEFGTFERELRDMDDLELWIYSEAGPMLCMLKNSNKAWLLYLSESGDSGFHSSSYDENDGFIQFVLCNGQVDNYPNAWCVPFDLCIKAIKEFMSQPHLAPRSVVWKSE